MVLGRTLSLSLSLSLSHFVSFLYLIANVLSDITIGSCVVLLLLLQPMLCAYALEKLLWASATMSLGVLVSSCRRVLRCWRVVERQWHISTNFSRLGE